MRLLKTNSYRNILYEQRGGYLVLPLLMMFSFSAIAIVLPQLEASLPLLDTWARHSKWIIPSDPGVSQLLLGAIAGSCITVVSVVYSILLIALTFASIQFSPRILTSFLKDSVSQVTLGLFTGTFAYCMLLLPSIHGQPKPYVPSLSMTVSLVLATACLFYLLYFIHHIALAIQANYIVDRIARETEVVLRDVFGKTLKGFPVVEDPPAEPTAGRMIRSTVSGYIQYIEEAKLLKLAIESDASVYIHRSVGQFIPAGAACLTITPFGSANEAFQRDCLSCLHIGPLRTMEDDPECGVLQMVDIALKAISPAVNDPSTAISVVDHLSAILILAATLEPPSSRIYDEKGICRVIRRQTSFPRLLEIAYNQISPYGKGDMAVSLRLMRALYDISGVTNFGPYLQAIRKQAHRVTNACAACFTKEECEELFDRLAIIDTRSRGAP